MKHESFEISEALLLDIERHCFSETLVEVGGFLVGTIEGEKSTITNFIPALKAKQAHTHLTFGHDTWDDAFKVLEEKHPGLQIVGWYHTHPDFGCFLSEYDAFIQTNFFPAKGYVALVVDPIRGELAWFENDNGAIVELVKGKTQTEPVVKSKAEAFEVAQTASTVRKRGVLFPVAMVLIALTSGLVSFAIAQNQGQEAASKKLFEQRQAFEAQQTELETKISKLQAKLESRTPTEDGVQYVFRYEVRGGDSLWTLAEIFLGDGNRYADIQKWNPDLKSETLYRGQILDIKIVLKKKEDK